MNKIYAIYGASGYGKEVYGLLKNKYKNIVFIDDGSSLDSLYGCKILTFEEFVGFKEKELFITIAIADVNLRKLLTEKCLDFGIKFLNVEADNVVKLENISLGEGSILSPFVTITSDVKIGKSFQANIYSYVAHDCVIGDYVTFSPAVKCNGNIEIGDYVYIGTGAIIKQGKSGKPLKIGKGAIVQAGAFVTRNIPDGMTVFGSPAIELTKENVRRRA